MTKNLIRTLIVFLISLSAIGNNGTEKDSLLKNISLVELANTTISISSNQEKKSNNAPGIITIIHKEEIFLSGARDLTQVLEMIPGMSITMGAIPYLSANMRGNFGGYGKILILIDGIELNENLFGVGYLNNLISVDLIERVEVIRGAGSVLYGGMAELGVINIITKTESKNLKIGLRNEIAPEQFPTLVGGGFRYSQQFNRGLLNIIGSSGFQRMSSEESYPYLFVDSTADLRLKPNFNNQFLSVHFQNNSWQFQGHFNRFQSLFNTNQITPESSNIYFTKIAGKITNNYKISPSTNWTNSLEVNDDNPYVYTGTASPSTTPWTQGYSNAITLRSLFDYQPRDSIHLLLGFENKNEKGFYKDYFFQNLGSSKRTVSAVFSELDLNYNKFFVNAGARLAIGSFFGAVLLPRFAVGYHDEHYYIKAIASKGFRQPLIGELMLNPNLQSEQAVNYELEIGCALWEKVNLKANIFESRTQNTIIWGIDPNLLMDNYINSDNGGSRGIESEVSMSPIPSLNMKFNFSYILKNFNNLETYEITENALYTLGIPAHTGYALTNYQLAPNMNIGVRYLYLDKTYSYNLPYGSAPTEFKYRQIFDFMLTNSGLIGKNWDIQIAVKNAFNNKSYYHNPLTTVTPAIQRLGRTIMLTLVYNH